MIAESAMAGKAPALAQDQEDVMEMAVREHSRLVYRIAYSVLRNATDAEDATQETFLRALCYGKKFATVVDPKSWLARIAWRTAVERQQTVQRAAARTAPEEDVASPATGAEQFLMEQERGALLEKLITALPDSLRDPLILSAIEELSPREVAETLGISEAAVRSRTFRGRQLLKERLQARMGDRK